MTCILVKSNRLQSRREFAQFMHRPPLGMYSGISHLPSLAEIPAFLLVVSIPSITLFHFVPSLSPKSLHGSVRQTARSAGAASSLAVSYLVGSGGLVRHSRPGSGNSARLRLAGSRGSYPRLLSQSNICTSPPSSLIRSIIRSPMADLKSSLSRFEIRMVGFIFW